MEEQHEILYSQPFTVEKSVEEKGMYLHGIVSTGDLDLDQDRIVASGINTDYFKKGGKVNWDHHPKTKGDPSAYIGVPVEVKLTKDAKGKPALYTKVQLMEGNEKATNAYKFAEGLRQMDGKHFLGASVEIKPTKCRQEGGTRIIEECDLYGLAITATPKNSATYLVPCEKSIEYPVSARAVRLDGKGAIDLVCHKGGVGIDTENNFVTLNKSIYRVEEKAEGGKALDVTSGEALKEEDMPKPNRRAFLAALDVITRYHKACQRRAK